MKQEKEKSKWKSVRSSLHTVHLWLGVASALILFVVCLSGTVYTFSSEIQKITDSHLFEVEASQTERLPSEELISILLDSLRGGRVQSITVPESKTSSYQISVAKEEKKHTGKEEHSKRKSGNSKPAAGKGGADSKKSGPPRGRGTTYFINPYTGAILGTGDTNSSAFFMTMFRLHRWLLLDMEVGRPIVGVSTLIFVVIILSGLVIWFPKKIKNWKQGLTIKTSANWKRINHDLHNSLGLYSSLFLLVMALTGLTWSFQWYKEGFNNMLGAPKRMDQHLHSQVIAGAQPLSIESAIAMADNVLSYPGDYRLMLPSDSAGVINIQKTKNTFFATSVGDRIALDQYSGAIVNKDIFSEKPLNEKVAVSVKALHIGSFYGTFSKILYFIACLIGTSLPVTGVIIWINKLRKKKEKRGSKPRPADDPSRKGIKEAKI